MQYSGRLLIDEIYELKQIKDHSGGTVERAHQLMISWSWDWIL